MILRNLLFFIAILLLIGWVMVVFVWPHDGQVKHMLVVLAGISLVLALTRKPGKDTAD
jgi:uncharacterized RDD family membrane protein YckC